MSSRSLDDLYPPTRRKVDALIAECFMHGIRVRAICTYRSNAEQAALFAKGRTAPGKIVTKARPGSSFHNCRRAVDFVILTSTGAVDWVWMESAACRPLWAEFGRVAKLCGLTWGGDWVNIVDRPHVEDRWCETCNEAFKAVAHFDEDGNCHDLVEG